MLLFIARGVRGENAADSSVESPSDDRGTLKKVEIQRDRAREHARALRQLLEQERADSQTHLEHTVANLKSEHEALVRQLRNGFESALLRRVCKAVAAMHDFLALSRYIDAAPLQRNSEG